ncbi:MAG: PIN domain-containing protein [Candidatus Accumulibacter sp.]|uniref:PIN domain-containing protein n=1 Tax=Accumulibacter sp. TaxID=2053492 RepID=UPI001B1A9D1A|nr:PIN domain-containing protein [Accumulibacter sp.]MBO3704527.1 PIN domain-containing protein [Accumulibacter sp.]
MTAAPLAAHPAPARRSRLKSPALLLVPAVVFLAVIYVLPLIDLARVSVGTDPWWSHIARVFSVPLYWESLVRTMKIALTVALYTEWQAVLTRAEHLPPGASADVALGFVRYLATIAHLQEVYFLWRPFLRDPDDDMVLECAASSGSEYIVTHNMKDFRRVAELKIQAITPGDFLQLLRRKP